MAEKELNDFFGKMLKRHQDICLEFEEDFQITAARLEKILFAPASALQSSRDNSDLTPQQIKKRTKRLSIIIDTDIEDNSIYSNNESVVATSQNDNERSKRPPRAAKTNIDFKEPPLNKKYRRPSNINESSKYMKIKIKEEENSNITNTNNNNKKKSNKNDNKQNEEILKKSIISEKMEIDEKPIIGVHKNNDSLKKLADESIIIIPLNSNEPIVELAESENENEKMPPPQAVPLKRNLRSKKSSEESIAEDMQIEKNKIILKKPIIKIEKLSLDLLTEKTRQISISQSENADKMEITQNEKSESTTSKKAGKKGKKQLPKPIKLERFSSLDVDESITNTNRITRSKHNLTTVAAGTIAPIVEKNISLESVYEDAIQTIYNVQQPESNVTINYPNSTEPSPVRSNTKKFVNAKTPEFNDSLLLNHNNNNNIKNGKSSIDDATFISAKDIGHNVAISLADATFVTQSNLITAQSTFIITDMKNATMIMNETQCINEPISNGDMTFDVLSAPNSKLKVPSVQAINDNIMTDDDSDMDIDIPTKYIPKLKSHLNKKELFNPCVQSPVKKKVEAFEKQAFNNINSPMQQRQTRTKTRAKRAKENSEPEEKIEENTEIIKKSFKEKLITPLIGRQIGRLLTPSQQTHITPGIGGIIKKLPNSTSKIMGIQKTFQSGLTKTSLISTSSTTNRTPSQSRDNSTEDLKRYGLKLQEQAEERKKKRELKQQQAQQVRERREKERADNLRKIMEDREEKARRKANEAEQKRQLDEINRQLKLQEEKREQQKKLEKQKQLEREASELARKEREMLENLKIQKAKEKLQLKYEQNKKQLLQKKLINNNGPKYDFDMLNSDDSTDDESTNKANRPPVPQWSKSSVRQIVFDRQSNIPTKVIDSFFSVQPLTPDLRDIFPSIDSRYLKRNSSVIWNTPPRYSQLSKKH